jgi:cyanophycinase
VCQRSELGKYQVSQIKGNNEMKKITILGLNLSLAVLLSSCSPSQTKGYLVIAGSSRPESIMRRFVELAERRGRGKIVVFPMASSVPAETGPYEITQLKAAGARHVEFHILTREQALDEQNVGILDAVDGIWFSGGGQSRLTAALSNTPIHRRLLEIYKDGGVIGGSSAGAAVMSEIMITGEENRQVDEASYGFETIEAANIVTSPGFGFIKSAIIDQHFVRRKRHNRLISLVAENPPLLGIGIDELTAIIVTPDDTFQVAGERNVIVYNLSQAEIHIDLNQAISAHNATMHILKAGDRFDLKAKKPIGPK